MLTNQSLNLKPRLAHYQRIVSTIIGKKLFYIKRKKEEHGKNTSIFDSHTDILKSIFQLHSRDI